MPNSHSHQFLTYPLSSLLQVSVEDSGIPKMRSQYTLNIEVTDQNDSPSTPRSVHITVFAFNARLPTGKIADVHPNDPDTSGDYRCKMLKTVVPRGVLTIASGCGLHASKITVGTQYSFTVAGNDGELKMYSSIL